MLKAEITSIHEQVGHNESVDEDMVEAWENAVSEWIYLPSQKRYGRTAAATNSDKVESLQVCCIHSRPQQPCCCYCVG